MVGIAVKDTRETRSAHSLLARQRHVDASVDQRMCRSLPWRNPNHPPRTGDDDVKGPIPFPAFDLYVRRCGKSLDMQIFDRPTARDCALHDPVDKTSRPAYVSVRERVRRPYGSRDLEPRRVGYIISMNVDMSGESIFIKPLGESDMCCGPHAVVQIE
ncbi:hypothetical protein YK56LOC_70400 [Caballeronia sp. HLA56]